MVKFLKNVSLKQMREERINKFMRERTSQRDRHSITLPNFKHTHKDEEEMININEVQLLRLYFARFFLQSSKWV